MPRRGYRKGISDRKEPRPHSVKSRISLATYLELHREAESRSMTFSSLLANILDAHATGERLRLPRQTGIATAGLRELCRIGNNLNQIAQKANLMRLHLVEADARKCLAAVRSAIDRLSA